MSIKLNHVPTSGDCAIVGRSSRRDTKHNIESGNGLQILSTKQGAKVQLKAVNKNVLFRQCEENFGSQRWGFESHTCSF